MANTDIELVDREFGHVRIPLSRKIKFKKISFTNISARWRNFRLNRAKSKLIADKEKLVDMEFKDSQLQPGTARSRTEKKVLRKTTAIAKLESKINFLETGNYSTEEFVNSRAIKLKDLMMKNLEYNTNSLYGVNEETAEQIISGTTVSTPEKKKDDQVVSDVQQQIAEEVKKIMAKNKAEQAAKVSTTSASHDAPAVSNVVSPESTEKKQEPVEEPVINIVNHKQTPAQQVERSEIKAAIDTAMSDIDVSKPAEFSSKADLPDENIRVSRNGSSAAKVNNVNEDGTYRLRKEDIPEEFRITRFDRSALPTDVQPPKKEIKEPDIPPFTASRVREVPNISVPRKAVTPLPEQRKYNIAPITMPKIKIAEDEGIITDTQNAEISARDLPMVVPERQLFVPQQEKHTETHADKKFAYNSDIQAVLNRASVLKSQAAGIAAEYAAEMAKQQAISENYQNTLDKLRAFVDGLEDKCNQSYESMLEVRKRNMDVSSQIDAMIEAMSQELPETEKVGVGARAK